MPKKSPKDLTFLEFPAWIFGKSQAETETNVPNFVFSTFFIHKKLFFQTKTRLKSNYQSASIFTV